jgi:hypothetical protein
MMKMMALALAATAVQAGPNTSRRQMQDAVPEACADLNSDDIVDVADLLLMLACASPPPGPTPLTKKTCA